MAVIEVDHLTKTFGVLNAVEDVSFGVEAGEVLVIMGASGCGKTTTLRCIAGLESPTRGTIKIEGKTVVSEHVFVPPEERGIGMVFQSYALWPHKTVFENVAYSLVIKRMAKASIREAVNRVIELVGLQGMEDRYPATLSGGQQQRVALARSAVAEPRVLLLDEPLSNLDAKLREQMRGELKHLIKQLGITAVHITHDQTEAMAIADRIICMRNGRVEQEGSARELYRFPANRYVADFIGMATFFDGTVIETDEAGKILVKIAEGFELWSAVKQTGQRQVTISLRPENVALSSSRPDSINSFSAQIIEEVFLGDHTEYLLETAGLRLKARSLDDLAVGSQVFASIDPQKVICLPHAHAGVEQEPPTLLPAASERPDPIDVLPPRT